MLLARLRPTGPIYVLVSISAIALVPAERLSEGDTPLLQVVEAGAPGFPVGVSGVITVPSPVPRSSTCSWPAGWSAG